MKTTGPKTQQVVGDGQPALGDGKPVMGDGKPAFAGDGKPVVGDGQPAASKDKPVVGDGTHNALILNALADSKWHSLNELRRVVGPAAINSRIAELRTKYEFTIERRIERGKGRRDKAVQYRLLNPPKKLPDTEVFVAVPSPTRTIIDPDSVPRDKAHRHRIYRVVRNKRELVGWAPTKAKAGELIYALGLSGEFAGSSFGWLDTRGLPKGNGEWVIQPWDTTPLPEKKSKGGE